MADEDPVGGPEGPAGVRPEDAAPPAEREARPSSLADALESPPEGDAARAYHQRARLAEDRLAEVLGAYRTMRAENEGYRDRLSRNLERRYDQRRERLLLKFIEILDNLDRALEAAEVTYAGNPLIEGLILVRTQLLQTLQEEGLERIPAIGLPYDPNHSEAVQTQIVAEPEHHHLVVKELLRGYKLNGRVARPSRVVVGEYPQAPREEPPPPQAPAIPAPKDAPEGLASEPSLEEIVAQTEAQEALFPQAFDDEKKS